jgi:hypothetical protein
MNESNQSLKESDNSLEKDDKSLNGDDKQLNETIDELKNISTVIYSLTIPVIRELFYRLADKYERTNLYPKIAELCQVQEVGSFKISLPDTRNVYIILKLCDYKHDLTKEFDRVKPYVNENQWNQIIKCISSMIFVFRSVFSELYKRLDFEVENELLVDPDNTTLYLECLSERVGVFFEEI